MAKTDIWMPLVIGDYLADTMHLETEEHGAYLLILIYGWRKDGRIPNDDLSLSKITGLSLKAWRKMRPTIAQFFSENGDYWTQKRQLEELYAASGRRDSARENGRKGGRPKTHSFSEGSENETQIEPEANPQKSSLPSSSPSFPSEKKTQGDKRPKFTPPTLEEVSAYCLERGNKIDPANFIDHYEARGWKLKGTVMVSWQAAIRTWEKNDFTKGTTNGTNRTTRTQRLDADAEQLLRDLGGAPEGDRSSTQASGGFSGAGNALSREAVSHGS